MRADDIKARHIRRSGCRGIPQRNVLSDNPILTGASPSALREWILHVKKGMFELWNCLVFYMRRM